MNQSASIQRLTTHLGRIESELIAIRQELKTLPEQQSALPLPAETAPDVWANKKAIREQMQQLLLTLSIQGKPVGAEMLQKQMRAAELQSNELSQTIISMREE